MKNKTPLASAMVSLGVLGVGAGIYLIPDPHNIGFIMASLFVAGVGVGMYAPNAKSESSQALT